jgi:hypothetical protein
MVSKLISERKLGIMRHCVNYPFVSLFACYFTTLRVTDDFSDNVDNLWSG